MKNTTSITVNVDLTVTDDTLKTILFLLECWQDKNPDKRIIGEEVVTDAGYKTVFRVERKV